MQQRGRLFCKPGESVYENQVIGIYQRNGDLKVGGCVVGLGLGLGAVALGDLMHLRSCVHPTSGSRRCPLTAWPPHLPPARPPPLLPPACR